MWHLKYEDGRHQKFASWEECQPVYARDWLQIRECYQDGGYQTMLNRWQTLANQYARLSTGKGELRQQADVPS